MSRDHFTATVAGAAAFERIRAMSEDDYDEAPGRPDWSETLPSDLSPCRAPCGWCTQARPCDARRAGMERAAVQQRGAA